MKKITVVIMVIALCGCAEAFRAKGEPYSGYSCRESIMHYVSQCIEENLSKEQFEKEWRPARRSLRWGSAMRNRPGFYVHGAGVSWQYSREEGRLSRWERRRGDHRRREHF